MQLTHLTRYAIRRTIATVQLNPIQKSQEYKKAMRQFRKEHSGALPPVLGRMKAILVPRIPSPNPVAESRVTAALALGQQGAADAVTNPPRDLHRNQPAMSGLGLPE